MKAALTAISTIMYVDIFLCKIVFKRLKKYSNYYNDKWPKLSDTSILCHAAFTKLLGYRLQNQFVYRYLSQTKTVENVNIKTKCTCNPTVK